MKILSNKKYGELVEINDLYIETQQRYKNVQEELNTMHIAFKRAQEANGRNTLEYANALDEKNKEIKKLKNEIHSLAGAKGGTAKYINRLHKTIQELQQKLLETQKQLEESMTDKYLIKKLPKDKTKSKVKMQVKSNSVESKIIKKLREEK